MKFASDNKLLTTFSVSSLTDIVMLLLIFFLLSSSFVMQPGIKVQLPNAETGETQTDRSVILSLTDKGQLFFNAERVSLEALGGKIAKALNNDPTTIVVVNADRSVTLQSTVQIIDIAKAVGATRFMIATQPLTER
jgi:biopolymer transport protein ExbD